MFGEMGIEDRSKIWRGLESCGEEVNECSDSVNGIRDIFSVYSQRTGAKL